MLRLRKEERIQMISQGLQGKSRSSLVLVCTDNFEACGAPRGQLAWITARKGEEGQKEIERDRKDKDAGLSFFFATNKFLKKIQVISPYSWILRMQRYTKYTVRFGSIPLIFCLIQKREISRSFLNCRLLKLPTIVLTQKKCFKCQLNICDAAVPAPLSAVNT